MSNSLYPIMMKCNGSCNKQHPLEDIIRNWVRSKVLPAMNIAQHYCFPCYDEKFFPEKKEDDKKE